MTSTALVRCLTGTSLLVALTTTSCVSTTSSVSAGAASCARIVAGYRSTVRQHTHHHAKRNGMTTSLVLEGLSREQPAGSPDLRIIVPLRLPVPRAISSQQSACG